MSDENLTLALSNPPSLTIPKGFFAYASSPQSIPATIRAAIQAINKNQVALIQSWEALQINGKYLVREICDAIPAHSASTLPPRTTHWEMTFHRLTPHPRDSEITCPVRYLLPLLRK